MIGFSAQEMTFPDKMHEGEVVVANARYGAKGFHVIPFRERGTWTIFDAWWRYLPRSLFGLDRDEKLGPCEYWPGELSIVLATLADEYDFAGAARAAMARTTAGYAAKPPSAGAAKTELNPDDLGL